MPDKAQIDSQAHLLRKILWHYHKIGPAIQHKYAMLFHDVKIRTNWALVLLIKVDQAVDSKSTNMDGHFHSKYSDETKLIRPIVGYFISLIFFSGHNIFLKFCKWNHNCW